MGLISGPPAWFAKSNTTYSAHGQIKHIRVYALERRARAIAQWAQNRSQGLLKRLRCVYSPRLQRQVAPSESSIRRTLADMDVAGLEGAGAGWLKDRAVEEPSKAIAVDGKTLRGSTLEGKQVHLISALTHDGVRVLN